MLAIAEPPVGVLPGVRVSEQIIVLPGRPGAGWHEINNRGEALGTYDNHSRSFIWSRENGFRDIGEWSPIRRQAINDCGELAGVVFTDNGRRAMRQRGEEIEYLGTLEPDNPTAWSEATAINERGDVVGWASRGERNGFTAFLWTEEHGMVALDPVDSGFDSVANDVNNRRQVVGTRIGPRTSEAALWQTSETGEGSLSVELRWRGILGSGMGGAGLNALGEAVSNGNTGYANPIFNSIYWSPRTGQIELWPYGPNDDYVAGSGSADVDDRGRIGGEVNVTKGPVFRYQAAIWTSPFKFHILTDQTSFVQDINSRGDVIGVLIEPDGSMGPLAIWRVQTPFEWSDLSGLAATVAARAICRSRGF
jgi:probable HAF family extracellular repeat protein